MEKVKNKNECRKQIDLEQTKEAAQQNLPVLFEKAKTDLSKERYRGAIRIDS